jgi:xanthine dehydrogenase YagR molybdenum-binding subunit
MPVIRTTKVEFEGRIEEREVIVEEEHVEPWGPAARLRLVGRATPRVDGPARVTGQAIYTSDVQLPGLLVGRILRSRASSQQTAPVLRPCRASGSSGTETNCPPCPTSWASRSSPQS